MPWIGFSVTQRLRLGVARISSRDLEIERTVPVLAGVPSLRIFGRRLEGVFVGVFAMVLAIDLIRFAERISPSSNDWSRFSLL